MDAQNQDLYLVCVDCGKGFLFTAGEQVYFAQKQLTPPKRCHECRQRRKADRQSKGWTR
jgi:DNA-directed RNA polymerase subunit RPC12/RpoP